MKIMPGEKYGALTVVGVTEDADSSGAKKYLCVCDCGNRVIRTSRYLHRKEAKTKSCGCQRGAANRTHGYSKTDGRLYRIWQAMRWRANTKNIKRVTYRKKDVECCEEWNDYSNFRDWALNNGYNDSLTLDRIDNDGNYCPQNCRWVGLNVQANNKGNNTRVEINGEMKTLAEISREYGINYSTIRSRVSRQHVTGAGVIAPATLTRDEKTGRFIGGYDL